MTLWLDRLLGRVTMYRLVLIVLGVTWLDGIWFCLDRQLAYTRCLADSGGADPATHVKIATPRSSPTRDGAGRGDDG